MRVLLILLCLTVATTATKLYTRRGISHLEAYYYSHEENTKKSYLDWQKSIEKWKKDKSRTNLIAMNEFKRSYKLVKGLKKGGKVVLVSYNGKRALRGTYLVKLWYKKDRDNYETRIIDVWGRGYTVFDAPPYKIEITNTITKETATYKVR